MPKTMETGCFWSLQTPELEHMVSAAVPALQKVPLTMHFLLPKNTYEVIKNAQSSSCCAQKQCTLSSNI